VEKHFVVGLGGKLAAAFGLVYLIAGGWAARVQPDAVKAGLATHPLYHWFAFAGYGWLALVAIAVLVALFSAAGGLTLGCSVGQTQIGLMFSIVLVPMLMFGCAYYPWSALAAFPVLQKLVLVNPLVYASEGLRGTLVPQYPHLGTITVITVLGAIDAVLVIAGLNRFQNKSVT